MMNYFVVDFQKEMTNKTSTLIDIVVNIKLIITKFQTKFQWDLINHLIIQIIEMIKTLI